MLRVMITVREFEQFPGQEIELDNQTWSEILTRVDRLDGERFHGGISVKDLDRGEAVYSVPASDI